MFDTIYLCFHAHPSHLYSSLYLKAEQARGLWVESACGQYRARLGALGGYAAGGYGVTIEGQGMLQGYRWMAAPPDQVPLGASTKARLERAATLKWICMLGSAVLWAASSRGVSGYAVARVACSPTVTLFDSSKIIKDEEIQLNRVDICVDHWEKGVMQPQEPLWNHETIRDDFASRTKTSGSIMAGGEWSTYTCTDDDFRAWDYNRGGGTTLYRGCRGSKSVLLRIYDKTIEATASGKLPWLETAWAARGWQGERVWRLEIEFGGAWLREHSQDSTIKALQGFEQAAWRWYFAHHRHVSGPGSRNKRRPISEVWHALQKAAGTTSTTWAWQPRKRNPADQAQLIAQSAGCLEAIVQATRDDFACASFGGEVCPPLVDLAVQAANNILTHWARHRDQYDEKHEKAEEKEKAAACAAASSYCSSIVEPCPVDSQAPGAPTLATPAPKASHVTQPPADRIGSGWANPFARPAPASSRPAAQATSRPGGQQGPQVQQAMACDESGRHPEVDRQGAAADQDWRVGQ
jgi:hypothetical protein